MTVRRNDNEKCVQEDFQFGKPNGNCNGDGHYLCSQCVNYRVTDPCTTCGEQIDLEDSDVCEQCQEDLDFDAHIKKMMDDEPE